MMPPMKPRCPSRAATPPPCRYRRVLRYCAGSSNARIAGPTVRNSIGLVAVEQPAKIAAIGRTWPASASDTTLKPACPSSSPGAALRIVGGLSRRCALGARRVLDCAADQWCGFNAGVAASQNVRRRAAVPFHFSPGRNTAAEAAERLVTSTHMRSWSATPLRQRRQRCRRQAADDPSEKSADG